MQGKLTFTNPALGATPVASEVVRACSGLPTVCLHGFNYFRRKLRDFFLLSCSREGARLITAILGGLFQPRSTINPLKLKMKNSKLKMSSLIVAALLATAICITPAGAQTVPVANINLTSITALLNNGIITVGEPFTLKGVTVLVTTNDAGNFVIAVQTPAGTVTNTPPTTLGGAVTTAEQYIAANNPANKSFYGTNEIVGRVGAVYLQNSGQAVVELGVEKYGLLKSLPQIGVGAAVFQGNNQGKSGTAGAVAFVDYRKIIGDVSAQIGVGGGYDNWNESAMAVVKVDVELRQNAHLGEYVGVGYALEKDAFGGNSAKANKGGLMVRGGVNYSF